MASTRELYRCASVLVLLALLTWMVDSKDNRAQALPNLVISTNAFVIAHRVRVARVHSELEQP